MKISPLEIRQKTFEKAFRGFDKDEVSAYLISLSHEWEKIMDENKEFSIKLNLATKEISKLREVESSLYKTLKTAEDTGANVIEQANKAAELQIQEARVKAEKMVNDADRISKSMIVKAEKEALDILSKMLDDVKMLEQNFNMIEGIKEGMISELKNLANDTLDRVKKFSKKNSDVNIKNYVNKAREVASHFDTKEFITSTQEDANTKTEKYEPPKIALSADAPSEAGMGSALEPEGEEDNVQKSFFDTIG
jgi:cell division initiation protein